MENRKLGSLNVSLVDIGSNKFAWRTDAAGTSAVVDAALDAGINFFDTVDVYGAGQSEVSRQDPEKAAATNAIVATKFGMKMSRDYLEGSAKDVGPSLSSSAATSTTFRHKVQTDTNG